MNHELWPWRKTGQRAKKRVASSSYCYCESSQLCSSFSHTCIAVPTNVTYLVQSAYILTYCRCTLPVAKRARGIVCCIRISRMHTIKSFLSYSSTALHPISGFLPSTTYDERLLKGMSIEKHAIDTRAERVKNRRKLSQPHLPTVKSIFKKPINKITRGQSDLKI